MLLGWCCVVAVMVLECCKSGGGPLRHFGGFVMVWCCIGPGVLLRLYIGFRCVAGVVLHWYVSGVGVVLQWCWRVIGAVYSLRGAGVLV